MQRRSTECCWVWQQSVSSIYWISLHCWFLGFTLLSCVQLNPYPDIPRPPCMHVPPLSLLWEHRRDGKFIGNVICLLCLPPLIAYAQTKVCIAKTNVKRTCFMFSLTRSQRWTLILLWHLLCLHLSLHRETQKFRRVTWSFKDQLRFSGSLLHIVFGWSWDTKSWGFKKLTASRWMRWTSSSFINVYFGLWWQWL